MDELERDIVFSDIEGRNLVHLKKGDRFEDAANKISIVFWHLVYFFELKEGGITEKRTVKKIILGLRDPLVNFNI